MSALTFALFKLSVAHAAATNVPSAHQQYAEDVGKELADKLKDKLPKTSAALMSEALSREPQTWVFGLGLLCLSYGVDAIRTREKDDLAESLQAGLETLLARPDPHIMEALPDCETLLLDRESAELQVAVFLGRVLDSLGVSSAANAKTLREVSHTVVEQVFAELPVPDRAALIGIGSILQGIRVERERNESLRFKLSQTANTIIAKLEQLTAGGVGPAVQVSLDGDDVTITSPSASPSSIPPSWVASVGKQIAPLKAESTGHIPTLAETYLEPEVEIGFIDERKRLRTTLGAAVASWMRFDSANPFVLIGDPGAGKTTACRWLAKRMYDKWLASNKSEREPFPILVPLREIRSDVQNLARTPRIYQRGEALAEACLARASNLSDANVRLDAMRQKVVLILDGFDELLLSSNSDVQPFIDAITLLPRIPNVSVVITGRTLAFAPIWPTIDLHSTKDNRWRRHAIVPFRLGRGGTADLFIRKWLLAADRRNIPIQEPMALMKLAQTGGDYGNLMETPVLLALASALATGNSANAPEQRSGVDKHYHALAWLIRESVRKRANPKDETRAPLTRSEELARLDQYGRWAWDTVLSGGKDFMFSSMPSSSMSTQEFALVEFFFESSNVAQGRAAFMHRTVAEFLAADFFVRQLSSASLNQQDKIRIILDAAQALAKDDISLEYNFTSLLGYRLREADDTAQSQIADLAAEVIGSFMFSPGRLPKELMTPLASTAGAAAELAITLLLVRASQHQDDIRNAVFVRTHSPRRQNLWPVRDPLCGFEGAEFDDLGLVMLSFMEASVKGCSFREAAMGYTNWTTAEVVRCDFSGADLSNGIFHNAVFEFCEMGRATLTGSDISFANFSRTQLTVDQVKSCGNVTQALLGADADVARAIGKERAQSIRWLTDKGAVARWDGTSFVEIEVESVSFRRGEHRR